MTTEPTGAEKDRLTETQITRLLAYLGETRHTVRKRNDSELECSCGASWALFSPEHTKHINRTFLTWADLGALKEAIERKGEWEEFLRYAMDKNPEKYYNFPYEYIKRFTAWLFTPLTFARIVDEWRQPRRK